MGALNQERRAPSDRLASLEANNPGLSPSAGWDYRTGIAEVQGLAARLGMASALPAEVRSVVDRFAPELAATKLSRLDEDQYDEVIRRMNGAINAMERDREAQQALPPLPATIGRVTALEVTVQRKVGLDNYGSLMIGGSMTIQLEPGDDPVAARQLAVEVLHAQVADDLARFASKEK